MPESENENTNEIEIEKDSKEEIDETIIYYDYTNIESIAKNAVNKVNTMNIEDKELEKWIIRGIIDNSLREENITDDEIISVAKTKMNFQNEWFVLAEEYGVSLSEEELDDYISSIIENASNIEYLPKLSKGLGITIEELCHNFDRDIYKKNLVWEKLRPILLEKYSITNNNELINKFNDEVKTRINFN